MLFFENLRRKIEELPQVDITCALHEVRGKTFGLYNLFSDLMKEEIVSLKGIHCIAISVERLYYPWQVALQQHCLFPFVQLPQKYWKKKLCPNFIKKTA